MSSQCPPHRLTAPLARLAMELNVEIVSRALEVRLSPAFAGVRLFREKLGTKGKVKSDSTPAPEGDINDL